MGMPVATLSMSTRHFTLLRVGISVENVLLCAEAEWALGGPLCIHCFAPNIQGNEARQNALGAYQKGNTHP